MHRKSKERMFLAETFPALAAELRQLLIEEGEPELAAQVAGLRILERCPCTDDFCATFYTEPKPDGAYGPDHRTLPLTPNKGMLILDVVGEKIACVEVLNPDEIRQKLLSAIP